MSVSFDTNSPRNHYIINQNLGTLEVSCMVICPYCHKRKACVLNEPPPICSNCKKSTFMKPMMTHGGSGSWFHLQTLYEDFI